MKVSDCLSRLVKEIPEADFIPDISDEIIQEFVIAQNSVKDSNNCIELFQIHQRNGHCGIDRLQRISDANLSLCQKVVKGCFDCASHKKVQNTKQILGTIADPKEKNHTWYLDFVFHDGKKYISMLDRSTRFCCVMQVDNRKHEGVALVLKSFFRVLGAPKFIVTDREFISDKFFKVCEEYHINHTPLTRESPFLNIVERYHKKLKSISRTTNVSLEVAAGILNNYPYSKTPKGCRSISPSVLFFENDTELVRLVCDFLQDQSVKRSLRSENLRGKNISRFKRNFQIGDLVKFNLQSGDIGFGKIIEKRHDKMYKVARIDGSGCTEIHAYQLELLTISEDFLHKMLRPP